MSQRYKSENDEGGPQNDHVIFKIWIYETRRSP